MLSFSGGLFVSSAGSSCVDIGSEGKIWKSVQNSLLTAFFTEKMKINHLDTGNIPFSWQTVDSFRPFSSPWEDFFWLTTWYIHVFSRKSQNSVTCLGKMQEISALEANIDSVQQISVKYLPFPHPDISLMTKIWLKGLHLFQYRRC